MTDASAQVAPTANFINPEALHRPFGYTHVVEVTAGRPVYLAGQVALDRAGELVGAGDIGAQARQVFENLRCAVEAAGGTLADIVTMTVFTTDPRFAGDVKAVRAEVFTEKPPASTMIHVAALNEPGLLLEINAMAVIPEAAPRP